MESIETICQIPELTGDSIHIWGIHVPASLDQLDSLHALLCRREQAKAARFNREADRQASIAARGALRIVLSAYTGIPAAGIEFDYSDNGKPHAVDSDVDFNVSHSGEWVVLAIGRNRRIGVDVESIKHGIDVRAIASRFFTEEEIFLMEKELDPQALFFQLWARKEAFVKACGSTLFRELGIFTVPIVDAEKDGWYFRHLEAGSKYAAAVVTDKELVSMPCYDFGELKWDS